MDRVNSAVGSLRNFVGWISDGELPEPSGLQSSQSLTLCLIGKVTTPSSFNRSIELGVNCSSTGFLIGPKKQFNMMFDPVRILSTIIYLFSIFPALFYALHVTTAATTLLAILIEACALLWYSLSYNPFAQSAARRWLSKPFDIFRAPDAVCQF
ncbi:vesicle transport protein SFT2B-like [Selaginella moellendorffii]|uniref:vesicle transport protein SFT2B-like n=1 Tax=Selaginella moellendorffii TaxID=88036 RepID=UPI000D1C3A2F|nr:vesicle transport protein SFT2B-like [Selaginella moellendorffii]|eukprot:XP_024531683.1 vesicle transport protein SFT2B-like [Selaginella moellendorffii]